MTILGNLAGVNAARTVPGTHPQDGDGWLINGIDPTYAEIDVDEERALGSAALFSALKLLGELVAALPREIRRMEDDGETSQPFRDHPAQRVVTVSANPEQTANALFQMIAPQAVLWGRFRAELSFDSFGMLRAIWPIHPDRITLERDRSNRLRYRVTNPEGGATYLAPRRVLDIPGFAPVDGLEGIGLVHAARQSIGLTLAAERNAAKLVGRGAPAPGFFRLEKSIPDNRRQAVQNMLNSMVTGENFGRPGLLEYGMDWKSLGIDPKTAQLLETRQFQVLEVSRWTRVPPHMLYEMERATHGNAGEHGLEFLKFGLGGWLARIEAEFNRKVLGGDGRVYLQHNVDALLRASATEQAEQLSVYTRNGILNRDEARARLGLNPIEDGSGQEFTVPKELSGAETPPEQQNGSPDQAGAALAADLVRREVAGLRRRIESTLPKGLDRCRSAVDGFYSSFEAELGHAAAPFAALGLDLQPGVWVEFSRRRVAAALDSETPAQSIEAELEEWEQQRAANEVALMVRAAA